MKNVLNALRMSVLFAILILVSCGKSSAPIPQPDPPPNNPPQTVKPTISATSAKGWYGESATGSVSATNATSITADPGSVNGSTYTVPNVTSRTIVKLVARDSIGQTAETTVVADCWSPKHSLLFKNGKWNGTTYTINGIPTPLLYSVTFRTDFTSVVTPTGGADGVPSPFSFNESSMLLTYSAMTWTVVTLTENDLVLSRTNADGALVVANYRH